MNTNAQQQRLTNAIIYFAQNTEQCGKIKLFKLLYLLDFQHFRETGKSVTGLDYQAWKFGPVPVKIMESWEDPDTPVATGCHIEDERVIDHIRHTVKLDHGTEFDDSDFSRRQLRIMHELVERYRDTYSPAMIDVTHQENGAWDKVWCNGRGAFQPIPYDLAVPDDDPHYSELLEIHSEQQARKSALDALSVRG
jgi:uncharacterized phage-associated protein